MCSVNGNGQLNPFNLHGSLPREVPGKLGPNNIMPAFQGDVLISFIKDRTEVEKLPTVVGPQRAKRHLRAKASSSTSAPSSTIDPWETPRQYPSGNWHGTGQPTSAPVKQICAISAAICVHGTGTVGTVYMGTVHGYANRTLCVPMYRTDRTPVPYPTRTVPVPYLYRTRTLPTVPYSSKLLSKNPSAPYVMNPIENMVFIAL